MNSLQILLFVILFTLLGLSIYEIFRLKNQLIKQSEDQKRSLSEAGNAITDALRTIFSNIKNINQKHERLNKNVKEIDERLQRLIIREKKFIRLGLKNIASEENSKDNKE
jgi:peptidoglycan hydrolase CwlO-like protein